MAKAPTAFAFPDPAASILAEYARKKGLRPRTSRSGIRYPEIAPQTNGGYVAKIPAGGIPAREGITPGQATCQIYRIKKGTGGFEIVDAGFAVDIFNVHPLAIPFNAAYPYFLIHQDQFGQWFNEAPNGPAGPGATYFRLTSNLEINSFATANVIGYAGGYVVGDPITVFNSYAATNHAPGFLSGMWAGITGMEGFAVARADGSGFDVLWMEQYARAIAFTITGSAGTGARMSTNGDQMPATVDYRLDQGVTPPVNGSNEITVHDDEELFPNAIAGAKGWALRNEYLGTAANPYYQVVECDQFCLFAWATVDAAMPAGSFAVAISNFEPLTPAPFGLMPPAEFTGTAFNQYSHQCRAGKAVSLRWGKGQATEGGPFVEGFVIDGAKMLEAEMPFRYRLSPAKKLEVQYLPMALESWKTPEEAAALPWLEMFPSKNC